MSQALTTLCLIQCKSWMNPLFPLLALWGNKELASQYESEKVENPHGLNGLKGLQMVHFEDARHSNPNHLGYSGGKVINLLGQAASHARRA